MTSNLPRRIDSSTAPMPFTRAGRLERRTRNLADEKVADNYLDQLEVDLNTQLGAARVRGALTVESTVLAGLADLGDAVSGRLTGASALARQLVAEALPGSSQRITGIGDSEIRKIAGR